MSSKLLLEKDKNWAGEETAALFCCVCVCDVRKSLQIFCGMSLLTCLPEEKVLGACGM